MSTGVNFDQKMISLLYLLLLSYIKCIHRFDLLFELNRLHVI